MQIIRYALWICCRENAYVFKKLIYFENIRFWKYVENKIAYSYIQIHNPCLHDTTVNRETSTAVYVSYSPCMGPKWFSIFINVLLMVTDWWMTRECCRIPLLMATTAVKTVNMGCGVFVWSSMDYSCKEQEYVILYAIYMLRKFFESCL